MRLPPKADKNWTTPSAPFGYARGSSCPDEKTIEHRAAISELVRAVFKARGDNVSSEVVALVLNTVAAEVRRARARGRRHLTPKVE